MQHPIEFTDPHILHADPANHAAPALVTAGSAPDRNLRAALAAAIEARREADDRAAIAIAIAARAEEAKIEASMAAERLKQGLDAEQAAAIRAHAEAITEALRRGEALPATPPCPGRSRLRRPDKRLGPA